MKICHLQNNAFTLAEVLITLGIIGVVAAISIPTLMNNIQENQFKVAYRKAFSVATQAWMKAYSDGDIVSRTQWVDTVPASTNFAAFRKQFIVTKYCDGVTVSTNECGANIGEGYDGAPYVVDSSSQAFIDNSGMAWYNENWGSAILVDTNGMKPPNQFGKDRFPLMTTIGRDFSNQYSLAGTPDRIVPMEDYENPEPNHCVKGGCYNTKWLYD